MTRMRVVGHIQVRLTKSLTHQAQVSYFYPSIQHQTAHGQHSDQLLFKWQNQLFLVCEQMRQLAAAAKLECLNGISVGQASHPLLFMPLPHTCSAYLCMVMAYFLKKISGFSIFKIYIMFFFLWGLHTMNLQNKRMGCTGT